MLFYTIQDGHGRYNFKHKFDSPVRADTGLHNWLKVSPKSDDINNNISASEYMLHECIFQLLIYTIKEETLHLFLPTSGPSTTVRLLPINC